MKSPSSMRIERFHPPKCRSKLQKMGVLYIHSPSQNFRPILVTPKKKLKKNPKIAKKKGAIEKGMQYMRLQAVAGRQPLVPGWVRAPNFWLTPTSRLLASD